MRAARAYLTTADKQGRTPCPVGNFHLSNGASLAQIDWLADTSVHGMKQSAGMMVNYLYDMARFETQQAAYSTKGRISVGRAVRRL
jgi:malonyl-CoA decarboxylase